MSMEIRKILVYEVSRYVKPSALVISLETQTPLCAIYGSCTVFVCLYSDFGMLQENKENISGRERRGAFVVERTRRGQDMWVD